MYISFFVRIIESITLFRNICYGGQAPDIFETKKLSFSVIAGKCGKVMVSRMVSGSNGPVSSLFRSRY